jgi:flagellar hook-basal body complex protein FliE
MLYGSADEAKFHAVGSVRETDKEAKETQDHMTRGREFYVDAVIVRIMKARKQLLHNDLIAQVVDNCKGTRVFGCPLPSVS